MGVAIEGMDIWYMVVVTETPQKRNKRKTKMGASLPENMELAPIFVFYFFRNIRWCKALLSSDLMAFLQKTLYY